MQERSNKTWTAVGLLVLMTAPALVQAQAPSASPSTARGQEWGNYVGGSLGEPKFGELGVKVFGGQQFHPNLAWEASFMNFLDEKVPDPGDGTSTEFWGVGGSVLGILPLQQGFSVFGRLGLIYGREKVRRGGATQTEGETNPLIGVGGQYQVSPRIGVRVEYEAFDQGNLFSAGITYRF